MDNGNVKCWGYNSSGQLGYGSVGTNSSTPTAVDLGSGRTAIAVALGKAHTCAIMDNGNVKCWGENENGQLGIGLWNRTDSTSPAAVDLGTGLTATVVTAGQKHTCVILNESVPSKTGQGDDDNSSVKCWGSNSNNQLGDNEGFFPRGAPDHAVHLGASVGFELQLSIATSISAGKIHTCAKLDNSSVMCWGASNSQAYYGQLGNGGTADSNIPVFVDL